MPEKFMTVKQVSEAYNLPISWVYQKAERGQIPGYKLGKYVKFRASELDAWLETMRRPIVSRETSETDQ